MRFSLQRHRLPIVCGIGVCIILVEFFYISTISPTTNENTVHHHHHHYHDTSRNTTIAIKSRSLLPQVRVICFVKTYPAKHKTRAVYVQQTWGRKCDKLFFVTQQKDPILKHDIIQINVTEGRHHLTVKEFGAFDYLYKNHLNDADWFLEADDDTYIIFENLRRFLASKNPNNPVFFGHIFTAYVKQGYTSGGAGYVISRETLRRFGERTPGLCGKEDGIASDMRMGYCLQQLKVKLGDSRDANGKSRFHCMAPLHHLNDSYPSWYYRYDKYGAKKGLDSISPSAISFHYVPGKKMLELELLLYRLRLSDVIADDQATYPPTDST